MDKVKCPDCGSEYLDECTNPTGVSTYICKSCQVKFCFQNNTFKKNSKLKDTPDKSKKKLKNIKKKWEKLVEKILIEQGKNIVAQKKLENGKILDLSYENTIVECKLAAGKKEFFQTIEKYADYCNKLEIWSLSKYEHERITTYVPRNYIISKIPISSETLINTEYPEFANLEVLYYEDIIKKTNNPMLLKEIESLYNEYMTYPNARCTHTIHYQCNFEPKYESFNDVSVSVSDESTKIYVNNAINKHLKYKIKYVLKTTPDSYSNINGIISPISLKKFKIPTNYFKSDVRNEYINYSLLELKLDYINKNEFINYISILNKFSLIDNFGNEYESMIGHDIDMLIVMYGISYRFSEFDLPPDIIPNEKLSIKLYFKIPDDLKPCECVLKIGESANINIELLKDNEKILYKEEHYEEDEKNKLENSNNLFKLILTISIIVLFFIIIFLINLIK